MLSKLVHSAHHDKPIVRIHFRAVIVDERVETTKLKMSIPFPYPHCACTYDGSEFDVSDALVISKRCILGVSTMICAKLMKKK